MNPVSKRELRKFGLAVGGAFLLFGCLSWWRGHDLAPKVLWVIGTLLVVPGIVAPGILGPVQRWWMAGAAVLGHVNTRIILTLAYYVVFTPIGFIMRLARDPLNRSLTSPGGTSWIRREPQPVDPASYERQF